MAVGLSDGTVYADSADWFAASVDKRTDKQRADQTEINQNSQSNDFESRFGATYASTMPLQASTELAGALKLSRGSGTPGNDYNTKLSSEEEAAFPAWKAKNAPNDSGADYDLRGAFREGLSRDNAAGEHFPDTYKKPNHPTFSDQSIYAQYAPDKAGTWDGDQYIQPAQASSIADDWFGKEGTPADIRPALGHFYETVKNAFKLPGDVYSGKVPAGSIQEIERATDLAGLMVMGPAPVAAKMADGSLGSFMGVQSKTFNREALQKAQQMEADGAFFDQSKVGSQIQTSTHPDDIWNATGTFRGADKRWRQEIPDQGASLNKEGLEISPATPNEGWTKIGKPETVSVPDRYKNLPDKASLQEMYDYLKSGPGKNIRLEEILNHPELYEAYPWAKNIRVSPMPTYYKSYLGMAKDNDIWMAAQPEKEFRSTLMHEIQHHIQDREGFARGGNPQMFKPPALEPAEKQFNIAKADAYNEIKKDTGLSHFQMGMATGIVKSSIESGRPLSGIGTDIINIIKAAGHFSKIENIAKAQALLDKAADEWSMKYRRLMGEVESRNVQARLDFDNITRDIHPPHRTESMIEPRVNQIDPADIDKYR